MRRIIVFVVVAATLIATIAGPVAAQAERKRIDYPRTPFSGSTENPCVPGEFVEISGWTEGFYNIVERPSGPNIIKGEFVQHAAGVDSEGNKWIYQGANSVVEDSFEAPDDNGRVPFTFQVSFKMISQGSAENFVVNSVFHVSPNGDITYENAGAVCRG